MGIFDGFRSAEPTQRKEPVAPRAQGPGVDVAKITNTAELDAFLRGGGETAGGRRVSEADALKVAAVYRCVRLLSGVAAGLPVVIKDSATNEVYRDHFISRLMNRRPNGWQHGRSFRAMLQESVLLRGNGYALKVWTGDRVTSLIPMSPNSVQCEQKATGELEYKYTDKFGRAKVLSQKDVFHLRGMSLDGITGMSVLQHARATIGFSLSAQDHGTKMFSKGTRVGGVLTHPEELSDGAYDRLKGSLEDFDGVDGDRYGRSMILEEGMEFRAVTMTSADAEFVENKKLGITEICMFFGVPPHLVGFTEKQTSYGSGVEHSNISFGDFGLGPHLDEWEGAIDRDLLTNDLRKFTELNNYKMRRGDQKTRWEANRTKLEMGTHSPNEIRRLEGEPDRPGGDVYYDPPNVPQGESDEPAGSSED